MHVKNNGHLTKVMWSILRQIIRIRRNIIKKKQWSALTDGYYTADGSHGKLKAVVQLIDLKAGATADDITMMEWLSESGLDWFIVATKADKLNKTDRAKALEKLSDMVDGVDIIPYSSRTGEGKNEVWNRIGESLV